MKTAKKKLLIVRQFTFFRICAGSIDVKWFSICNIKKVGTKKKPQTTHTLSTILICLRCNKSLSVWIFMITYCQIKTIRPISSIRIDPMKKKILKAFFFRQIITFYKSTHTGSVISWLPLASRLRLERYRNIRIFLSTDLSF